MKFKFAAMALTGLAVLAGSVPARAADIPRSVYKAPPAIAYYNWTGFYLGVNAGYGFGNSDWSAPAVSPKPKGFLAGGTVGYNYQTGSIVWGIEGDFDWQDVHDSVACAGVFTCRTSSDYLATIRGRVGYAFDRWLPYITGGGAYGNIKAEVPTLGLSSSKGEFGWTVGAGLEYAFLSNWSAKIEYLYVDLGDMNPSFAPATSVSLRENVVRAGLNYKFSGPIFSRY